MAFPEAYVIEREHCPPGCRECEKACPAGAVELEQTPAEEVLNVGAVLVTTGWDPYQVSEVWEFGYGLDSRVISNLEMEGLLGPETERSAAPGFSLRDCNEVGFIQCAGSRDKRHLPYCSSVCCSAPLSRRWPSRNGRGGELLTSFFMDMRFIGLMRNSNNAAELGSSSVP